MGHKLSAVFIFLTLVLTGCSSTPSADRVMEPQSRMACDKDVACLAANRLAELFEEQVGERVASIENTQLTGADKSQNEVLLLRARASNRTLMLDYVYPEILPLSEFFDTAGHIATTFQKQFCDNPSFQEAMQKGLSVNINTQDVYGRLIGRASVDDCHSPIFGQRG